MESNWEENQKYIQSIAFVARAADIKENINQRKRSKKMETTTIAEEPCPAFNDFLTAFL